MPCCSAVLSAAAADSSTPSWLRRLHTKGGLSFPSNLRIDDLYGERRALPPLPPPPPSSAAPPPPPPPNPTHHHHPPRRSTNPSRPIPTTTNPPPPPPPPQQQQLAVVVSDPAVVVPTSVLPPPPTKAIRKQTQPRAKPKKDKKVAVKKRRRSSSDRGAGADGDGEGCNKTEVTVIDSSIEGWKAAKLVIRRGAVWKIRDIKKALEVAEPVDSSKAKRRAGLVSKIKRDRERARHKEMGLVAATSSGNIHANSGDMVKESDCPIEALKRLRCSEPEPEAQIRAILP